MFTTRARVKADGVSLSLSTSAMSGLEAIRESLRKVSSPEEVIKTLEDGTTIIRRYNRDATSDLYYRQGGYEFGPFRAPYIVKGSIQATVEKVA